MNIPIPTLAIFASPHDQGPWTRNDPAARGTLETFARFDEAMMERQAAWVERRVGGARVVSIGNNGRLDASGQSPVSNFALTTYAGPSPHF